MMPGGGSAPSHGQEPPRASGLVTAFPHPPPPTKEGEFSDSSPQLLAESQPRPPRDRPFPPCCASVSLCHPLPPPQASPSSPGPHGPTAGTPGQGTLSPIPLRCPRPAVRDPLTADSTAPGGGSHEGEQLRGHFVPTGSRGWGQGWGWGQAELLPLSSCADTSPAVAAPRVRASISPSLHLPEILQHAASSIWQRGPPPPRLAGRRRNGPEPAPPGLSPTPRGPATPTSPFWPPPQGWCPSERPRAPCAITTFGG